MTDSSLYRPAEVDLLVGSAVKAKKVLGWKHNLTFDQLVDEMVENDCRRVRDQK